VRNRPPRESNGRKSFRVLWTGFYQTFVTEEEEEEVEDE
jgi:hypothetical protein